MSACDQLVFVFPDDGGWVSTVSGRVLPGYTLNQAHAVLKARAFARQKLSVALCRLMLWGV